MSHTRDAEDISRKLGTSLPSISMHDDIVDSVDAAIARAEARGAAFAIKVIDDLHIGSEYSDTTDKLMKGIKNTIRYRFEGETGTDPAPNYPVAVKLHRNSSKKSNSST